MSDQPHEHILTIFGKNYPVNNASVGFPKEYYNKTYELIQNWYSEKPWNNTEKNDEIGGKPYTRPLPYQTWNSGILGVIGLTEFLQNLGEHMLKLLLAIGAKADEEEMRLLIEQVKGSKGVMFMSLKNRPPAKDTDKKDKETGKPIASYTTSLKDSLKNLGNMAETACKKYNVLSCQISDAVLVNALAAIVTMQRAHIRMNEELYIESSTNCPLAVTWEGKFGPHGVGRWDKIGSNPNILEVPPGSRNQESAESAEIRTKPPKAPKALKPLSKPQLVAPANPQLSELVTEDVTVDDIPVGFPVGPAPIPGGVLPGGYTEQFPEENGYNAPRAKVQRLI